MMPFLFSLIYCLHILGSFAAEEERAYLALSFGKTTEDYIQFTPSDMSPFQSSFTGCAWIKRQNDDGRNPVVLDYEPVNEIIMGSDGYWNCVHDRNLALSRKFPENMWFHYCMSWSAGGKKIIYINGGEVGSTSALSRNLTMGGEICLGNAVNSRDPGNRVQSRADPIFTFGGQLYKLNLFSEVLSSSEIRQMSEAGMCSSIELKHETRALKWEEILREPRYGNVVEFVPPECVSYLMTKVEKMINLFKEI